MYVVSCFLSYTPIFLESPSGPLKHSFYFQDDSVGDTYFIQPLSAGPFSTRKQWYEDANRITPLSERQSSPYLVRICTQVSVSCQSCALSTLFSVYALVILNSSLKNYHIISPPCACSGSTFCSCLNLNIVSSRKSPLILQILWGRTEICQHERTTYLLVCVLQECPLYTQK